jgi:hypothetical protein
VELMELPKVTDNEIKELQTYEAQALSVKEEAEMVARAIHDAATNEAATQWVIAKKAWCANIREGWLGQQANRIFKMHREWTGKINSLVEPVEGDKKKGIRGVVDIVIDAQLAYKKKQQAIVDAENARLFAEARKKDEEERLAAAEKLEAQGNKTMADAVLAQAGNFVAPVVKQEKGEVVPTRKVWRTRIDPSKKSELLKMIADRPDLHAFVVLDVAKIEKHVANLDGNLVPAWPGVTPYQEDVPVYRRG